MGSSPRWGAVLFDLDGTVIEPFAGIASAVRHAFAAVGEPAPPDATIRTWIGPPIGQALHDALGARGEAVVAEALAAFRAEYDARGARSATLHAGMRELVAGLRDAGVYTAVVTMKPQTATATILEHLALPALFDDVHAPSGHEAGQDKQALVADAVAAVARTRAGVRSVMVGDRTEDVVAARRCGVDALGVRWGFGDADDLARAGALAVADRPADLAVLLGAPLPPAPGPPPAGRP